LTTIGESTQLLVSVK